MNKNSKLYKIPVDVPVNLVLNMNQRKHYMATAQTVRTLRATGRNMAVKLGVPAMKRAVLDVYVAYPEPKPRRRDLLNYYPTVKALVDGFVDAHVLPDDDDKHVEIHLYRRGRADGAGMFRFLFVFFPDAQFGGGLL